MNYVLKFTCIGALPSFACYIRNERKPPITYVIMESPLYFSVTEHGTHILRKPGRDRDGICSSGINLVWNIDM